MKKITIALAGNPNVGKSTVFNALTGMRQHTGNWPGKTVDNAVGHMKYKDTIFEFTDLPGAYSLSSQSPDEAVTGEYIRSKKSDIVLIVADATCLQRNLLLIKEILSVTGKAVLCLNLIDEAKKKGIEPNVKKLQNMLGIPVVTTAARSRKGLSGLIKTLYTYPYDTVENIKTEIDTDLIYRQCVTSKKTQPHITDRKIDKIVTSKVFGFPIMLFLLFIIFWITMAGANYPSSALSSIFGFLDVELRSAFNAVNTPDIIVSFIMDGLYTTVSWVISVMLPPMAIFFPLFTLLEDLGYFPRAAFNLDNAFRKCGAHGKQSLTMCMGFGCNACGVMGCRIIESPRERLIAMLTNCFVPCNGRFPTLISMILIFFVSAGAAFKAMKAGIILTLFILLGITVTLLVSKLLSLTILKGMPSSFVLELPPYRKPRVADVIIRSILDRTVFVLGRAVIVAAPFGALIWILANIHIGNASILDHCTVFLDPFGRIIGLDGVIIMAFILGFPANEIVIPIMLMCYMSSGMLTDYGSLDQLQSVLTECGWTLQTGLSVIILCLFHFPCGTTCLTIKKETGSIKWTIFAFLMPTVIGAALCFIINTACLTLEWIFP